MHAVRIIRALFPAHPILADVRIAEAGSLISKMAFDAGASWVSVVSGATLNTVEAVVKEAGKQPGRRGAGGADRRMDLGTGALLA